MSFKQRVVIICLTGLIAAGCSNGSGEESIPTTESTPAAAEPTTTAAATTATTASTTEAPTTTLSESQLAQAAAAEVVVTWWQLPYDSSQDMSAVYELETGLQLQQSTEYYAGLADRGRIERNPAQSPIEITSVSVDLDQGTAEINACTQNTHEFIDAETGEPIESPDADFPFMSRFLLTQVDGEWKINAWVPSVTEPPFDDDQKCEIGA